MKPRTLILMIVAIVCGLAASYMTSRVIADRGNQNTEEKVTVLVAKQNLPMATKITDPEKLFEEKQFTKGEEPKKAIRDFDQLKGKFLNKPLSAEQFVTPDDVDDKNNGTLASMLQPGMRAVGIKVTTEDVAGGFVQPHTRVDIMSVIQRSENETYAKMILQNILVLAVDQQAVRDPEKQAMIPTTVTVEVTPEQAEKLGLAMQLGRIKLTLRALGDEQKVTTRGVTPKQILSQGNDFTPGEVVPGEQQPWNHQPGKLPSLPKVPNPPTAGSDQKGGILAEIEPPQIHTMTIMNGSDITRAQFQLNKNGEGAISIKKSQPDIAPAPRPIPSSKDNKPEAGASGLKPATKSGQ
jgi:pilus assembly protein CpaB